MIFSTTFSTIRSETICVRAAFGASTISSMASSSSSSSAADSGWLSLEPSRYSALAFRPRRQDIR